MSTYPPKIDPEIEHAGRLFMQAVVGKVTPDEAADAFVAAVRARWGRKTAASQELLDRAEDALDAAEAATDPSEAERQMVLFELLMQSARC